MRVEAGFHFHRYKNFLILELESSISWDKGNFFGFFGLGLGSAGFRSCKYKKRLLHSKHKKSFPLRKYKIFVNIKAKKFHFLKYKYFFFWGGEGGGEWFFFFFFRLQYFKDIPKEIRKFIANENVKTNIYRVQINASLISGYFYVGFIDFMLKSKSY